MDTKVNEIIEILRPGAEYKLSNRDFSTVEFFDNTVLTQAEFDAGVAQYDAWKAEQDAKAVADKAALLAKLGITADEFKTLLS